MTWTALDDPRYRALAMRSAAIMGNQSPQILNAILAHWRCEIGSRDVYPPARNNPGDVAEQAAKDIKADYTVVLPNPQPGNPIVSFSTSEAGADAYGQVIAQLPRYAAVRTAVAANDPVAYMEAVAAAGYGTGYACMAEVYREPADYPPSDLPIPPPTGTYWWVATDHRLTTLWKTTTTGILRPVNLAYAPFHAYTGRKLLQRFKNPDGTLSPTKAYFRQILSTTHYHAWIRVTEDGAVWHPI